MRSVLPEGGGFFGGSLSASVQHAEHAGPGREAQDSARVGGPKPPWNSPSRWPRAGRSGHVAGIWSVLFVSFVSLVEDISRELLVVTVI